MGVDTSLSEMLVPMTRTEQFNKSLEMQKSNVAIFLMLDI